MIIHPHVISFISSEEYQQLYAFGYQLGAQLQCWCPPVAASPSQLPSSEARQRSLHVRRILQGEVHLYRESHGL